MVQEACANGSRRQKACELLGISLRTIERWDREGLSDQRKGAEKVVGNKLSEEERQQILSTVNGADYCDLPPCKIVPHLADKGIYMASESTIYRILREERQLAHRGLTQPAKHKRPKPHEATGPNQLWSWDITYLPTQVRGMHFYLYMIMDVYSRKIVGWTVQHNQLAEHSADLIEQACMDEGVERNQVVLHSDNGSPMKAATMLAKLESLGVAPSFSRPSVSDDNPFSEALFNCSFSFCNAFISLRNLYSFSELATKRNPPSVRIDVASIKSLLGETRGATNDTTNLRSQRSCRS